METGNLIEIKTKYEEEYSFNNAEHFHQFVVDQHKRWESIDIDYAAREKKGMLGISEPWAKLLGFFVPLSSNDRLAGIISLVTNQRLRDFQTQIHNFFSSGSILIHDSIEGEAFRNYLFNYHDFVVNLKAVISEFNQDTQNSLINLSNDVGRKVFHVIFDCRIKYEMAKAKKEINFTYDQVYQDLKSFLDSGKSNASEIEEEIKNKSAALQQLESGNKALLEDTKKEFESLKSALREKIAIAEPVIYWKQRSKSYAYRSAIWGTMTVAVAIVSIYLIWLGLENIPDISNINDVKNQIKVTVLFITGIGVITYVLSMFGRMFLSSMHILSDIDERSSLTQFYLSLIEGGKLDEKQREIILQSLFSRTDSGIIKGGTEMNFPGGIESLKSLLKSK